MARYLILNELLNYDSESDYSETSHSENYLKCDEMEYSWLGSRAEQPANGLSAKEVLQMCRICMGSDKNNMVNIFEKILYGKYIYLSIEEFTKLNIRKEDILPQMICKSCLDLLKCASMFRDTCIKTDSILRRTKILNSETNHVLETLPTVENDDFDDYKGDTDTMSHETFTFDVDIEIKSERLDFKQETGDKLPMMLEKNNIIVCKPVKNSTQLKSAIDRQTLLSNLICDICGAKFKMKSQLTSHIKWGHNLLNELTCKECKMVFSSSGSMKKHYITAHTKSDIYMCEVCAKLCRSLHVLKSHLRVHTNAFPHACPHCPYRARLKESVRQHMRQHTGERPYVCDLCPATFTCRSNLNGHVVRAHEHVKKFKCALCDKSFAAKHHLRDHLLAIHEGVKKYQCNYCGAQFGYRKGLNKHLINVHKQKKSQHGKEPLYIKLKRQGQSVDISNTIVFEENRNGNYSKKILPMKKISV